MRDLQRRAITFVLSLIILTSLAATPIFAAKDPIEVNYDGLNATRGTDQLIVFTGGTTTGTNEWGYEVTCDKDGVVIAIGGNNSEVPENGFVLSGHGTMRDFLENNIKMGDVIFLNEDEKKVIITEDGVYSPFYTVEVPFNGVNITRGTDFIVVYDSGETTKTNTYGYEVVCDENGYAVILGGNNSAIPKGGFVLSGHGAGSDTLKRTVQLGCSVKYDAATGLLTVDYQLDSLKKAAEIYLAAMLEAQTEARLSFRDVMYDKMEETIAETKKAIAEFDSLSDTNDTKAYRDKVKEISALKDAFEMYNTESFPVETRGVWLRPQETTPEQVKEVVANIKAANLNAVYIETYFGGMTICYTRPDDLYEQNPIYNGFDVLQAYIDECHAQGIQVHLWNTVFNAGGSMDEKASLAAKKPEWLAINKSGAPEVKTEYGNMYFINPANKEATDYLIDFYTYVLSVYDIDGIQLDYIRYPNGDADYGYNPEVCADYNEKYGVDPMTIEPGDGNWAQWCEYRAQLVTDFVTELGAIVKEKRPDILYSADLFADLETAPTSIMQNGKLWIEKGYIDAAFPMSYGEFSVTEHAALANSYAGDHCYNFIGTATYLGYSVGTAVALIEDAHEQNCDGFTWFEYSSMVSGGYGAGAVNTVLRAPAISQLESLPAFTAEIDYIINKLSSIIVPFEGMTQEAADALKTQLEAIKALAADDLYTNREAVAAAIKAIQFDAVDNARLALNDDLAYALKMVNLAKPAFTATFEPKPEQTSAKEPDTTPETPEEQPTEGVDGEENLPSSDKPAVNPFKENAALIGIGIGAVVLIAASALITVFTRKNKKKKKDKDGK